MIFPVNYHKQENKWQNIMLNISIDFHWSQMCLGGSTENSKALGSKTLITWLPLFGLIVVGHDWRLNDSSKSWKVCSKKNLQQRSEILRYFFFSFKGNDSTLFLIQLELILRCRLCSSPVKQAVNVWTCEYYRTDHVLCKTNDGRFVHCVETSYSQKALRP